jgi:hypothetical protein
VAYQPLPFPSRLLRAASAEGPVPAACLASAWLAVPVIPQAEVTHSGKFKFS